MKIGEINVNKVASAYGSHKKVAAKKVEEVKTTDTVQLSKVGRSLSSISGDDISTNSKEKVEAIRKEVANGTYKRDLTLTAKKMIQHAKGSEI